MEMKLHVLMAASLVGGSATPLIAAEAMIVEAESRTFSGWVEHHSCWHNVMLTDDPHSTHSGSGVVDTPNKVRAFIAVGSGTRSSRLSYAR